MLTIMTSKQDIIHNTYYDRSGFGSRAQTLKDSREKEKSITKEAVEEFFKKMLKTNGKWEGKIIHSSKSFSRIPIWFVLINDLADQKVIVGAIMIDVLSKYMVVVPIKSKSEGDVASALIEG